MKTCGTCKHWGRSKDAGEVFRPCQAVIHDEWSQSGTGVDLDADWLDDEERAEIIAFRKLKAVVVDGSGYLAALRTQEDFGCVLHEVRL